MLHKQTSLEWAVAETDDEWRAALAGRGLPAEAASPAAGQSRRAGIVVGSVVPAILIGILFIGAGAYRLWQRAQAGLRQIETELRQVVEVEQWARRTGHQQLLAALIDDETPAIWRQQVEQNALALSPTGESYTVSLRSRELRGDRALVQLVLARGGDSGEPRLYRETRFYRATQTGWRRTAPDARFWGAEETVETSAFFFRYRRRDAATVRAVAAKLEITYQTLRTTLGLPPPLPNEKIGIEVTLTRSTNHPRTQSSVGETLTVLSPELITAPVEVTEVEVLYQAVAPKLVGRLLTETMRHYAFDPEVWSIKGALRLWLIGESGGPLAVVTHEMIQWLYLDLQGQAPIRWEGLPSTYDRICELHRVWGVSPLDLSLPLTCSKVHRARTERKPPLWSLVEPAPPLPIYNEYGELVDHVRHTNESIALATVFNYVVATYESKQFPLLLTALAAEERWETLTPAIFDVSAEEFEHSWRLFLAERYGVPRSW